LSQADTAAQLVADIIHRKVDEARRTQEAAQQAVVRRRQRSRAWYFLFALPLLIGLTTWNLVRATRRPAVFSPSERESAVRFQMYLAAQALQAYHDSTGRWPADLRAIGMEDAHFVYERRDGDFTITDTTSTVPLVFRHGDPLAPYAAGYVELKHASGRGSL
jgi:hypothetical protein